MPLSERLKRESEPFSRWIWFVVEVGNYPKRYTGSDYTPKTGHVDEYTFPVKQALEASAAACLEALTREQELAGK